MSNNLKLRIVSSYSCAQTVVSGCCLLTWCRSDAWSTETSLIDNESRRHLRDFVYNISRTMINCWVFLSSKMILNLFLVAAPWCSTTIVLSQQECSGFEPADLLEPSFVAFACFSCVCGFWTKECILGCDPKCICNCGCESVGLSTDPPLWHSCKQEKWMDVEFLLVFLYLLVSHIFATELWEIAI